eukprot:GFYU01014592.1.p1 GENE.GFYU01014592.1~~GFYU01014592.1.p1  ORF type:complete len:362 (+),score=111.77 GFYU01014592.1:512-1597(+)
MELPSISSTTNLSSQSVPSPTSTYIECREKVYSGLRARDLGIECVDVVSVLIWGYGYVCGNDSFGIAGVKKYGFFLKELRDARNIRNRIIENFELACEPSTSFKRRDQLLHFVVVGGGPTGVEFAAELSDFIREDAGKAFPEVRQHVKVTLFEATQILASFAAGLQHFTKKRFEKMGIMVRIGTPVADVKEKEIILSDGETLPYGLLVWSTGLAPRGFLKDSDMTKTEKGTHLLTDDRLRVMGSNDIYAIGDCAAIEDNFLPATAQVAEQQGKYLSDAFNGDLSGDTAPFKYKSLGMLAYVGGYKGVSDFRDSTSATMSGFDAWIVWRAAYMTKMGSWKNRMNVPFDWMRSFIFGRDISRF